MYYANYRYLSAKYSWMLLLSELPCQVSVSANRRTGCGYGIQILNNDGKEPEVGREGFIAVKLPLPPGCLLPNRSLNNCRVVFRLYFLAEEEERNLFHL